jgi:hypothetical protein
MANRWASAILPHISVELERRAEISDRVNPRRRSRTVERALLLAEVEGQIADYRASTRRRKGPIAQAAWPVTESVPVQTTPEPIPAFYDVPTMLARLKAQRDARQAAAS